MIVPQAKRSSMMTSPTIVLFKILFSLAWKYFAMVPWLSLCKELSKRASCLRWAGVGFDLYSFVKWAFVWKILEFYWGIIVSCNIYSLFLQSSYTQYNIMIIWRSNNDLANNYTRGYFWHLAFWRRNNNAMVFALSRSMSGISFEQGLYNSYVPRWWTPWPGRQTG